MLRLNAHARHHRDANSKFFRFYPQARFPKIPNKLVNIPPDLDLGAKTLKRKAAPILNCARTHAMSGRAECGADVLSPSLRMQLQTRLQCRQIPPQVRAMRRLAGARRHWRRLHAFVRGLCADGAQTGLRAGGARGATEHALPLRASQRRRSAEGKPRAGTARA